MVLARYLLSFLDVSQARMLSKGAISALLLLGTALALFKLARTHAVRFAGFAIAFTAFARWFGIEMFGQSFAHAPADVVVVAYLILACLAAGRGAGLGLLTRAAAIFGASTAVFELLSGGLPLGLAMVVGCSPVAYRSSPDPKDMARAAFGSGLAFVTGAVACIGGKIAVCVLVFGPTVITDYSRHLALRMALGPGNPAPPNDGVVLWLSRLIGGLSSLAGYSRVLAGGTIFLAVASGIWGLRVVLQSACSAARARSLLLACSNLAIVGWFPVFWQHSIQHAWFTDRILVWPITTGFWLFAAGVASRACPESVNAAAMTGARQP